MRSTPGRTGWKTAGAVAGGALRGAFTWHLAFALLRQQAQVPTWLMGQFCAVMTGGGSGRQTHAA